MSTLQKITLSILLLCIVVFIFHTHKPAPGLDNFVALTEQDPLFYSPYFNNVAFTEAINELQRAEENLKKIALQNIASSNKPYTETYTNILTETTLFPTDFLALLPEISSKTEDFTAQPTNRKARHLLSLHKEAQEAYERDAKLMHEAFKKINDYIPDNRPVYYFFINSATSVHLAKNNHNLIYKNSVALKEEINRRQNCLSKNTDCEIIQLTNTKNDFYFTTQKVTTSTNAILIRDNLPFASSETREVRGPYSITSACWGQKTSHQMYAIYSENDAGEKLLLPKLAKESYYNLISPEATDVISEKIRSLGLDFFGQAEGTTYECSDLTFYPDILAKDFLNRNPTPEPNTREYSLFIQNKFGALAPALQSLASFTNLLETSQRISADFVLSPQFLFTTRSAYSLTYLPFAQSVWRIEEELQYLVSEEALQRLGTPKQFKSLTELQQEGYGDAEIIESQIDQRQVIEGLVE